jgi:hypothetical protein
MSRPQRPRLNRVRFVGSFDHVSRRRRGLCLARLSAFSSLSTGPPTRARSPSSAPQPPAKRRKTHGADLSIRRPSALGRAAGQSRTVSLASAPPVATGAYHASQQVSPLEFFAAPSSSSSVTLPRSKDPPKALPASQQPALQPNGSYGDDVSDSCDGGSVGSDQAVNDSFESAESFGSDQAVNGSFESTESDQAVCDK